MRLCRALQRVPQAESRVVTLGNFDGVHAAHQAICSRVVQRAAELGLPSAALTFHPHPAAVLAPEGAPAAILTLGDRLQLLAQTGVDLVVAQRFNRAFAHIEAPDFVRTHLVRHLHAKHVVVGHSVRFGRGRAGDEQLLRQLGESLGFAVEVIGPVRIGGDIVSSTAIRGAIKRGDVQGANVLLGREHFARGRVVPGKRRGAGLGFPTANLRARAVLLPPDGVYAVRATHCGETYGGVANLGVNPTFGAGERSLEAHLFDFRGDLYGELLRLAFVQRLRGEVRFDGPQALAAQIRRDVEAARAIVGAR